MYAFHSTSGASSCGCSTAISNMDRARIVSPTVLSRPAKSHQALTQKGMTSMYLAYTLRHRSTSPSCSSREAYPRKMLCLWWLYWLHTPKAWPNSLRAAAKSLQRTSRNAACSHILLNVRCLCGMTARHAA